MRKRDAGLAAADVVGTLFIAAGGIGVAINTDLNGVGVGLAFNM